jgi:hypothetical protein
MEILQYERVGSKDRDRYLTHLAKAYSEERISADEHEARITAVSDARTSRELDRLIADLPGLPVDGAVLKAEKRTAKLARLQDKLKSKSQRIDVPVWWRLSVVGTVLTAMTSLLLAIIVPMIAVKSQPHRSRHLPLGAFRIFLVGGGVFGGIALAVLSIIFCVMLYDWNKQRERRARGGY